MHQDRNNRNWPALKTKPRRRYDDAPLESVDVRHSHLDGEAHYGYKEKKDRAAKQLVDVQNMFKDMAYYADKQANHN